MSKKRKKTTPPAPERPMVSIAGIRGVVGASLRLDEYVNYAQAFMADLRPRRIVVGSDTRLSREMLRHLVFSAAIASGVEVFDLGVVPTPTVGLMVRHLRAGGGIALTASHNPAQWNALKFFSSRGTFLTPGEFSDILKAYEARAFHRARVEKLGRVTVVPDPLGPHLKRLLAALPVAAIRRRSFKVVLDACNGAGLELALALFAKLKVSVEVIHGDPDRKFEREAEPLAKNLRKLRRAVTEHGADVGFALDPDADRLAIVDEGGRALGEERTIVLAADYVLGHTQGRPMVVNLSTTRAVDDVAARHGVEVHRTRIGEAHVVDCMRKVRGAIGGEGNGGVIYPPIHMGRDSATGMGLILAHMTEATSGPRAGAGRKRAPLSQINGAIPDYVMVKDKIELPEREAIVPLLANLKSRAADLDSSARVDKTDGVKISLSDRWLHVRASGTEPIARIFAEAPTKAAAQALIDWARQSMA